MSDTKFENVLDKVEEIALEQEEKEINEIVQLANGEEGREKKVRTPEEEKEIDEIVQLANGEV